MFETKKLQVENSPSFCKVHKELVDPSFKSIMAAVKTPTHNLGKFLVPLLEPITTNMYIVKNSFEFTKNVAGQDTGHFMASLDVEPPFFQILLEETINVCFDSLFTNDAKVNNINRTDFEKLLGAALQNNFKGKIHKLMKLLCHLL